MSIFKRDAFDTVLGAKATKTGDTSMDTDPSGEQAGSGAPVSRMDEVAPIEAPAIVRRLAPVAGPIGSFLIDYDAVPNLGADVSGIDNDIRAMSDFLILRESKNILISGAEGSGKTTRLKGFVAASRRGDTSLDIMKRSFFELDNEALSATDDNAEINRNMAEILSSLERRSYAVLIIDNAWSFISGLQNKGAYGAINTLIRGIKNGLFQTIAVVKDKDLELIRESESVFKELFTLHKVPQQTAAQTLNTLRGKKAYFQRSYGIVANDDALKAAVELSEKFPSSYAPQLAQPGRATRLFEYFCATYRTSFMSKPEELLELEGKARDFGVECQAIGQSDPQRVKEITQELENSRPRLQALQADWSVRMADVLKIVNEKHEYVEKLEKQLEERTALERQREKDRGQAKSGKFETSSDELIEGYRHRIADLNADLKALNVGEPDDHPLDREIVYKLFNKHDPSLPIDTLGTDDLEKIFHLEDDLKKRVMGQDHAVHATAVAIKKNAADMSEEGRPMGSFFLLGPSGTGKSELGMALDEFVTGIPGSKPIIINMTDYQEAHKVSTLFGAPPGYSGTDAGGVLIRSLLEKKRGVLMFDEIEKAHEKIFDVLMPMMDKALATSATGQEASLENFIILATSNIGASYFLDPTLTFEEAQQKAMELLKQKIRPEILGRFNDTIFFKRHSPEVQFQICQKFLTNRNKGLFRQKFAVEIDPPNLQAITKRFYNADKGGRSLRNVFEGPIDGIVAETILIEKLKARRGEYPGMKLPPGGIIPISMEPDGSLVGHFRPRLIAAQAVLV